MSDNDPKYLSQALRLVQSLRWFGGQLATAEFFVCIVDEVNEEFARHLKRLGAQIRIVPRFDPRQGTPNKLRFLELPELDLFDTIVMLDCDTVVVQDPLPHLNGGMLQAKMADLPTVSHDGFFRLFEHFGLPLPPQVFRCNPSGVPTIWYCNSGVLIFPQPFVKRLFPAWTRFTRALLERLDLFQNPWFCEQSCLALAYAVDPVPFGEFGLNMNFPMHLTRFSGPEIEDCDPVILHYHDRVDDEGFLHGSPFPKVQSRVEQFNKRLHEERMRDVSGTFSANGHETRSSDDGRLNRPLFVVGCMRSGTTLLADCLGRSEGIVHCPFELKHVWSEAGAVPMASPKTRETKCPELGAGDVTDDQRENLTRAFLAEMARHQTGKRSNAVFLNKNPHLYNKLPFVLALFPDARFIWIHRRLPRVVASLKRLFEGILGRQQTWHYWPVEKEGIAARCWEAYHFQQPEDVDFSRVFPGGRISFLAEYWLESNRAIARFFQGLPDDQKISVYEEDLIERPGEELSRCLMSLGETLDESLAKTTFDLARNANWASHLSEEELRDLSAFIGKNATEIDKILPDESLRSATVLVEAFGQLDRR